MVAKTGETEKNTLTTEYDYEKNPLADAKGLLFLQEIIFAR